MVFQMLGALFKMCVESKRISSTRFCRAVRPSGRMRDKRRASPSTGQALLFLAKKRVIMITAWWTVVKSSTLTTYSTAHLGEQYPVIAMWLSLTFCSARTRELPGNYPFVVTSSYISMFTARWRAPAKVLCKEVFAIMTKAMNQLITKHFSSFGQRQLEQRVRYRYTSF